MEERIDMKYDFTPSMLNNLDLTLNIISDGVYEIPKRRGWSLERDHIFPRSLLDEKGMPNELTNRVGNLRFINKTRNILKRARLPDDDIEFFDSDDPGLKKLFLEAKRSLTEENFRNFVQTREKLIFDKVRKFLGFSV